MTHTTEAAHKVTDTMEATRHEAGAISVGTGLTDSTHSSTSSASGERYRLNHEDTRPILLYTYRGKLETSSQKDLCALLDKDEKLRATRKQIPRATSYIDVKRHDLYLPDEKDMYSDLPNYDSSLASVKIPSLAYWSRLLLGNYEDLFIISPETTPSSSIDGDSRRASPTGTWGQESQENALAGATRDRQ